MKKELDGEWIPLRLGIRDHLKKMTTAEATLFMFYLVSVDHRSWSCFWSISYLAQALDWSEQRIVDAKKGLTIKGYIKKEGQTRIYIPKLKKFKKQAEAEITAPLLARIKALEKQVNTKETLVNTKETLVNTKETLGNTREREKKQQQEKKEEVVVVDHIKRLKKAGVEVRTTDSDFSWIHKTARSLAITYFESKLNEKGIKTVSKSLVIEWLAYHKATRIDEVIKRMPRDRKKPLGWITGALNGNWDLPPTQGEQITLKKAELTRETEHFEEEHRNREEQSVDLETSRKRAGEIVRMLAEKMTDR